VAVSADSGDDRIDDNQPNVADLRQLESQVLQVFRRIERTALSRVLDVIDEMDAV